MRKLYSEATKGNTESRRENNIKTDNGLNGIQLATYVTILGIVETLVNIRVWLQTPVGW
jgi:hypothetical protein